MLKLTALGLGFITAIAIVPAAESAIFEHHQPQGQTNSRLHAEKLIPLKKLGKLAPTVIKGTSVGAPKSRSVELSPQNKERERIKTACQPQFGDRNAFKSNELAVGILDNSKTTSADTSSSFPAISNTFNNSNTQGNCGFFIPF